MHSLPGSYEPPEDPGDVLETADVYGPMSDDEQSEVDDKTVSEVVRKPTRAAGDLSEAAGASAEITLEELLRRVHRIEEHLGIGDPLGQRSPESPSAVERRSSEDMLSELTDRIRRIERSSDDLRERVSRIERKTDTSRAQGGSPGKAARGPASGTITPNPPPLAPGVGFPPEALRPPARPDQPEDLSKPED
jgi:hypothetical protein